MEIWKPIPGYTGYEASNQVRIKSTERKIITKTSARTYKSKILNPSSNGKSKHLKLAVRSEEKNRRIQKYVHELVCLAFIGPRPKGMEIAHNDGNSQNNMIENLRYASHKENENDKIAHGKKLLGERHPRSKLTHQDVEKIKALLKKGETQLFLSKKFGVTRSCIASISQNRTWK